MSQLAHTVQGVDHVAFPTFDPAGTVAFYRDVLGFPVVHSICAAGWGPERHPDFIHFFFDIGNDNLLAFFDFPGLDQGPYQEVLGGLHHLAISVEPSRWERLRDKLTAAGVEFAEHSDVSLYFRDPDGARIELIADPLGEMYGSKVL